jgi:hypothetical protein
MIPSVACERRPTPGTESTESLNRQLVAATSANQVDVVKTLLSKGASVDAFEGFGATMEEQLSARDLGVTTRGNRKDRRRS